MPAEQLYVAEPGGRYTRYPPLVVDCSVLAAVLFDEPQREAAALAMAGKELFAPDLIDHEMVSVALKKAASGLADVARRGLVDLGDLRLTRRAVEARAQFPGVAARNDRLRRSLPAVGNRSRCAPGDLRPGARTGCAEGAGRTRGLSGMRGR